jgi:ferredoxin
MDEIARTEKEEELVLEITTKKCGTECKHCEHNEECNNEKPFRQRYCGACRVKLFHGMLKWQDEEFERKTTKIKEEGTQEFMSTGRILFTNPASYEYIHVNSNRKFCSHHTKLSDAVAEYLADPDRDLSLQARIYENMKIRCEEKAKVFVQVYLGGKKLADDEVKVLKEKYARIDTYGSQEFIVISDVVPYEYIHLNEHIKFRSDEGSIKEAIKEYIKRGKPRPSVLRNPFELDEELGQIL